MVLVVLWTFLVFPSGEAWDSRVCRWMHLL